MTAVSSDIWHFLLVEIQYEYWYYPSAVLATRGQFCLICPAMFAIYTQADILYQVKIIVKGPLCLDTRFGAVDSSAAETDMAQRR